MPHGECGNFINHDRGEVRCVVTWQGGIEPGVSGDLKQATEVISATPFVTVRHMRLGRELERFLEDEVRRECSNQGLAQPMAVKRLAHIGGLFDIVECRRNRKSDPVQRGFAFRLRFERPVLTPFALGCGCTMVWVSFSRWGDRAHLISRLLRHLR